MEVVELAGYTQRVANMFTVFDECSQSRYVMMHKDRLDIAVTLDMNEL